MHIEIYKSILYYFVSYYDIIEKAQSLEESRINRRIVYAENETYMIGDNFNLKIKKGMIPTHVKYVSIGDRYNQVFERGIFPENLYRLQIGHSYNLDIGKNILNRNLKELIFVACFNKRIMRNVLPHGLIRLDLGNEYNKKINKNVLPKTLKYLKFGFYFNYPIEKDVLPESLEELELGGIYQQPIYPDVLPKQLRKLKMLCFVNQFETPGIFPNSIREMILYNDYRKQYFVSGMIPEGVEKLEIHHLRHRVNEYRGIIPSTVKYLKLIDYYGILRDNFLCEGLNKLYIQNFEEKRSVMNPEQMDNLQLKIECIPKSVKYFRLYVKNVEWIGDNNLSHLIYISLHNNKLNIIKKDLNCFIRRDSKYYNIKQIVIPNRMENKILKSQIYSETSHIVKYHVLEDFLEEKIEDYERMIEYKMICMNELKERINFPCYFCFS